ncbi:hypothetical protein N7468_000212 [Penicillium chermesinum]|uniref:Uncharacterized protein n=1 Tax=Penicillium chermesinum TaxID=63820 RepID=A0A9W9PJV0_9EURO|nr:uncharacterized protein N7468_000212 [Penicillium chermesinum]KAJ5248761.1 hypothetical protein N7468_000212 [Penicillium chermesinum]
MENDDFSGLSDCSRDPDPAFSWSDSHPNDVESPRRSAETKRKTTTGCSFTQPCPTPLGLLYSILFKTSGIILTECSAPGVSKTCFPQWGLRCQTLETFPAKSP